MKRLLIFMITTLNICFLLREGLQKESACQTSGAWVSTQNLMATLGLALKTWSMPHGKHMAATWLSHLYLTSLHDKIRSSSSTAWRQWGPLRGQKTAVNGTLTSCCACLRDQRPGRPSFKVTWSQTKIMSPRACFGCSLLFDPSEYSGDILCKLTNILTITANFLICIKLHQKDIGGVDELRKLRILR